MDDAPRFEPCLLVVDDQDANVTVLRRMLERAGYSRVEGTTDPREVVPLVLALQPDLILLDLRMPDVDGFEVLARLRPHVPEHTYLPVIVLTADISPEARQRALSMGAKDFIGKPFDSTEVLLRIKNVLEARALHLALQRQNALLEEKVRERTRQLEEAQLEIIDRLGLAAEYRDDATHAHTRRVGDLSARLAARLGLPEDAVELIRLAAPLHDLGKIALPDQVLLKPGELTGDEFDRVKDHTRIGARILSGSRHPLLQLAEEIALTHHEHWDGTGYSTALAGERIPLVSRIVAVADAYDALINDRPYKRAWPATGP